MSSRNPWICVFGSNLFNQLDPDDTSNPTKKIPNPRLIHFRNPNDLASVEILHVADSQSLVHYTTSSKHNLSGSGHLEIWGFDENQNSAPTSRRQLDLFQNKSCISHPIDQVKQWLGRTKIMGYLALDGTINPFNLTPTDTTDSLEKHMMARDDRRRYQAMSISDNGQALAAVLIKPNHQTDDLDSQTHTLELWSSFEELLKFSVDGLQTNSNPKSFQLTHSSHGETEIQLASGVSHFLILTSTPRSPQQPLDTQEYRSTLYGLGDNRFGQLGTGSRAISADEPTVVEGLGAIWKIDCGLFHSVAVGNEGEMYTFGHNRKGQCGIGDQKADLTRPVFIDLGGNGEAGDVVDVLDASCGSEHSVALTSSGIWLAGSNALGQLASSSPDPQTEFQLSNIVLDGHHLSHPPSSWKIKAGRWNTFIWANS